MLWEPFVVKAEPLIRTFCVQLSFEHFESLTEKYSVNDEYFQFPLTPGWPFAAEEFGLSLSGFRGSQGHKKRNQNKVGSGQDIFILQETVCPDDVSRTSCENSQPWDRENEFLCSHGVLHLTTKHEHTFTVLPLYCRLTLQVHTCRYVQLIIDLFILANVID